MGLSARATGETLALMVGTFLLQAVLALLLPATIVVGLFALTSPLPLLTPWTLVTSVYAHGGLVHLLGNAAILVPFGIAVEQVTSRWRYHGFFVVVGALSGYAQVLFGTVVPGVATAGVLGASGAILGLVGYAIAGNDVADTVVSGFELDLRAQLAAVAVVGAALALWMAGPGVANVGHFVGLALGLVAGRARLLHVSSRGV